MRSVAKIYVRTLEEVSEKRGIRVIVHPVLPVLDITRCVRLSMVVPSPFLIQPCVLAVPAGPTCLLSTRRCGAPWRQARASHGSPATRTCSTTPAWCVDPSLAAWTKLRRSVRLRDPVETATPFTQLRAEYKLDGTHIHPSYLQSVATCLARMS